MSLSIQLRPLGSNFNITFQNPFHIQLRDSDSFNIDLVPVIRLITTTSTNNLNLSSQSGFNIDMGSTQTSDLKAQEFIEAGTKMTMIEGLIVQAQEFIEGGIGISMRNENGILTINDEFIEV